MNKKFLLIIILLISSKNYNLLAQEVKAKNDFFENHPIDFAVGNFSVGMPFSKVFINRYYPLITLGTEFYYLKGKNSQIFQTATIGGFYNKYNTSAFFLNTEIGYRYKFDFGLFADAGIGVGYSHLFHPNAIFKQNNDEEYEQVRDWGTPSLITDFSVSIGYDFSKRLRHNFSIFLRYGNYIQLFYNPDIPALPQNSFQIGTRFFI